MTTTKKSKATKLVASGPKLRGKLNIWVGEQDPYFLNDSVHLLAHFLARANPPFTGRIVFVPGGGHGGFHAIGSQQMVREMEAAVARAEGRATPPVAAH